MTAGSDKLWGGLYQGDGLDVDTATINVNASGQGGEGSWRSLPSVARRYGDGEGGDGRPQERIGEDGTEEEGGQPETPAEKALREARQRLEETERLTSEGPSQSKEPVEFTTEVDLSSYPANFTVLLPEDTDFLPLARLLVEGFQKAMRRPEPSAFGPLAPLVRWWNRYNNDMQEVLIQGALRVRCQEIVRSPTIQKPRGRLLEGHSLALMMVERGASASTPPLACCELCLVIPDGRRTEDWSETVWPTIFLEDMSPAAAPYLLNLCVSPRYRRKGAGRTLLQVAEDIVVHVWGRDRLYLHSGKDEAALGLYTSAGYSAVKANDGDSDAVHMYKQLRGP